MNEDLSLTYAAMASQSEQARVYTGYYEGKQPLLYTHERLRQVFGRSTVNFIQNWVAVVVDSTLDRIVFKGWDNPDPDANELLDGYYENNRLRWISRQVHRDAVVTGNGFLMVDLVDGLLRTYYNSPEQVVVLYKDDDPSEKYVGAKSFYDSASNTSHYNIYYPDHIEKYAQEGKIGSYSSLRLVDDISNPFGKIPIIHFRNYNELVNVLPLQNAINKVFSDMMVVAEFSAFPQRWMITNADISSLVSSPQSIMKIPKGASDEESTSIGEFGTANMGMYLETIDKLTNAIAIITRTPKHYLLNTGSNLSGEALSVMESPLVKKVIQLMEGYEESWKELAGYITQEKGTTVTWDKPETTLQMSTAQAMQTEVNVGIPLVTVLRRQGWNETDIQQMLSDLEQERIRNAKLAKSAYDLALLRLSQNNTPEVPETSEVDQSELAEQE